MANYNFECDIPLIYGSHQQSVDYNNNKAFKGIPSHVHSYNACVSKVDEDDDDQERLSLLYGVCSSAGDHHNKSLRHDKSVHCTGPGLGLV